ncbi:hypothetical protein AVEN_220048-1 [Araneus ventricosus]|uniref:Mutator-like transposase domain-containing protein n=1 Tax=Araneus ventricosus TaxID=182803 RepID=A0A4Y2CRX0_ARAVE|nr:hypothetical protein AVEN_220048-1 [Araneus ventricosus]
MYYNDTTINKLECIGHIQKRVGTRIRKLKNETPSVRDKGKLTDKFIDKLQNYYEIAIHSVVGNLKNMQTTVISAFYHCCSVLDNLSMDNVQRVKRAGANINDSGNVT